MAKRRRRRGEQPKQKADERSKNFFILLGVIFAIGVLGFIALRLM